MNITADFAAVSEGKKFPRSLGTFFLNPCFHAVALFRLSSLLYRVHLEPLAKIVWYINRMLYHVDIDYRARLAPGFKLVHGLGVVIGEGVVSEGHLTLYQGVTLGGTNGKYRDDGSGRLFWQPHFGKDVVIYTGSCVFGPVCVGDGAIVKAGRIITKDVEKGDVV